MRIAVVGATGMVGRKIIEVLQENKVRFDDFIPFASERSAGKTVTVNNTSYDIVVLNEKTIKENPVDYAIFSAGGSISKTFAPLFAATGAIVIDNSNAWRRDKQVPLVVPQVNGADAFDHPKNIIANPNCSTIQLVTTLFPLMQFYGIKRFIVSTYQSVSGAGQKGYDDLKINPANKPQKFIYPIVDNMIPHIDVFLDNGYTLEEDKIIFESKKIMNNQKLRITATAIRVPVAFCHGETVNITFKENASVEGIRNILRNAPGVVLQDNPETNLYPMPVNSVNKNDTYVGRIRKDDSEKNSFNLWIVADNIRRGAATNAVEILQLLQNKK